MGEVEKTPKVEGCQAPRASVTRPRLKAPAGSTDCHFHIFGPHARYPLSPGRRYTPPEATVGQYRALAATLGIERMVVVQPSIYGTDNACTLDAVAAFGQERARAVAVLDESANAPQLRRLHEAGVRGVRFNAVSGNGTPLEQLQTLARRIAPLGWHLQLYVHGEQLLELAPRLPGLGLPVVVDHMGGISSEKGVGNPEFRALLGLMEGGRMWVKLCGYRSSAAGYPFRDVAPMAEALITAAPERCLWGTDWPHPSYMKTMPDDAELLDLFGEWAPSTGLRRRILAENPVVLYGFPPVTADCSKA
ncbi:MAG: amidohydrolase family protein [Rhodospirillales bacterium]|nr:amidohydrolase family protein [Rhodospirillales bacterium]